MCGECICEHPYTGKYCEYKCPVDEKNKICGGNEYGTCSMGKCNCNTNFDGIACKCSKLTDNCILPGMEECSNRGTCKCNKCECDNESSGDYCEKTKMGNNTLCEMYDSYVEAAYVNKIFNDTYNNVTILIDLREEDSFLKNCGK